MKIKTDENEYQKVHVYDGIVEQNNPMPGWWIWIFIFTIIFGFLYWLHYEMGGGSKLIDEYNMAMQKYKNKVEKNLVNSPSETEESLIAYMKNENALVEGAKIYAEKCSMCHGVNLEGKIGPNLTDNYWVHGRGSRLDIVHTIAKGSPAKGMPPWEGLLKPAEIKTVAAFVYSKIDTQPTNAKAPDGIKVK